MLPCGRNNAIAKGHRLPRIDSKQSAGKSYALRHGYRVHVLEQEATQHRHGDRLHSSHAEFLNSFEHELRHLVDDIAETFGLDMGGEQVAYLTGDLNSLLWKDIHEFMCCCNCKT